MAEHTSLPTFLEVDPYPTSPSTRPVSGISSIASADDFSSARERLSTLPSPTSNVEIGLPPSRALRSNRSTRDSNRPSTATHIPIEAAGFSNPLSSQVLQRQRAPVVETEHKRRYSAASVNTLREAQDHHLQEEEIPPLPSRGTDAPQSVNSTAELRPAEPPVERPVTSPPKSTHRNYEYYAGNTIFILGLCIQTRARPFNIVTALLIIIPAALFFAFSAPFLWTVSPAIPIIYAYAFYLTISGFAHAAFIDPGVLPRNIHPLKQGPLDVPQTDWVMIKGDLEQAMEVPTKFCRTCMIQRPPRAHHCRTCDHCVETQDHHCVWLNNCVGRRNYRYFFSFISSATLMALLQVAFTAVHISRVASDNDISFGQALDFGDATQTRMSLALLIYAILGFTYPFSLLGYHIFLMSRGETTREYLNSHKFPKKDRHRPFSLGWRNLAVVLLRPRPPSYMQFTKKHVVNDLRYGYDKPKVDRQKQYKGRYSVEMKQMK